MPCWEECRCSIKIIKANMLQFITKESDRFSLPELVQMVIEGGCRWVQLRLKEVSDAEVRQAAEEIIPLCRETDTFLIIDDRVNVVNELKVSGVHLGSEDMSPGEARELLGPHAIIGETCHTAREIIALKGLDIDYIGLGPFRHTTTKKNLAPVLGVDGYENIIQEVRNAGVETPIVAIGGITLDDVEPIMSTGVNGLAVCGAIADAHDPVEATAEFIEKLNKYMQ